MKRSEMIKIITNTLMAVHLPSYYYNNNQKQLALELLRDIEKAGMLPPNYTYEDSKTGKLLLKEREWELEEE